MRPKRVSRRVARPDVADPLWSRIRVRAPVMLGALGMGIEVAASSRRLEDMAIGALGRFERPEPGSGPALRLRILDEPGRPRVPSAVHGETLAAARDHDAACGEPRRVVDERHAPTGAALGRRPDERMPVHREHGRLFAATASCSIACADLAAGDGVVFVGQDADLEAVRRELFEAIVWRVATHRGLVALHAACVVVHGVAIVLRGASGSGKSTLAYAAGRSGHAVLAEEVTWFDPGHTERGIRSRLRGAPWTIKLDGDVSRLFPELADRPPACRVLHSDHERLGWPTAEAADLGTVAVLAPQGLEGIEVGCGPNDGGVGNGGGPRAVGAEGSRWRKVDASEGERAFEAGAISGELAQPAVAFNAARSAILREGAYLLPSGAGPRALVGALEEIAMLHGGAAAAHGKSAGSSAYAG